MQYTKNEEDLRNTKNYVA